MYFIRDFKVILPVQEDSILSAALENVFNVTDASQVSIIFTPTIIATTIFVLCLIILIISVLMDD